MRRIIKPFIFFAVISTLLYGGLYMFITNNPDYFLTEGSQIYYYFHREPSASIPNTGTISEEIPLPHTVTANVVHWGWLNFSHEKHFVTLMMLFVASSIASYFKFPTRRAEKRRVEPERVKKPKSGLEKIGFSRKREVEKTETVREAVKTPTTFRARVAYYFAVYGLFIALWEFSLMFMPMAGYDFFLLLIMVFVALGLLSASGLYLFAKTRKEKTTKMKVGNALTLFGAFLAIWFVLSTFLAEWSFFFLSLGLLAMIVLYVLSRGWGRLVKSIGQE